MVRLLNALGEAHSGALNSVFCWDGGIRHHIPRRHYGALGAAPGLPGMATSFQKRVVDKR